MKLYHIFLILVAIVIILLFINILRYKMSQKKGSARRIKIQEQLQENRRTYYGKIILIRIENMILLFVNIPILSCRIYRNPK